MSIGQVIESRGYRDALRERDEAREGADVSGVTVVVPCYEQQEYLERSMASVAAQTIQPLEVLIIDDGSRIPIRWDEHRVIRISNRGLPNARNTGLLNARGHAFLPLDADDWLEPTFIEKTLPLLDQGFDVVVTGLQEHGERTGTYRPGCDLGLAKLTVEAERMSNRLFYCSLFRTSLLRNVGGYNGRMIHGYEDWDLWIDLMQRGARMAAVDEPLFNYRTRKDGMLAQTEAEWRDWNWDEMARHHGYKRPQPTIASARQQARLTAREQRLARRRT